MKTYKVVIVFVMLFYAGCKDDVQFDTEPEIILDLIERMEQENTGFELSVSVEPSGQDSLLIAFHLLNNTDTNDSLSTSSGFPTRIPYRYGEELITIFGRNNLYPDDMKIHTVPARDSILLSEWYVRRVDSDDYVIRGVFRYSIPPENTATDYWLVSNPVLVKKYSN